MDEVQVERILQNPKFKEMVRRKSNLKLDINSNHVVCVRRFYAFSGL